MQQVIKRTSIFFYLMFIVTILSVVGGYYFATEGFVVNEEMKVNLSSAYFLYVLAVIPLTFYLFNKQIKKTALIENENVRLEKYQQASTLRILLIGSAMILGTIIFSFLFRTQSILFCTGIAVLAMLFCVPSKAKLISELGIDDEAIDEKDENTDTE